MECLGVDGREASRPGWALVLEHLQIRDIKALDSQIEAVMKGEQWIWWSWETAC